MANRIFSPDDWNRLLDETIEKIKALALLKGGEYAGDDDRLANFRRNGQNLGMSMEAVWGVYAGKHYDSIAQYIKDINGAKERPRSEPIEGRADDLIVYLILFKAILIERGQSNVNKEFHPITATKVDLSSKLSPEHEWKGDGPMPKVWFADDGTKVYRDYAAYCED